MAETLYFDTCAINRLNDDAFEIRVHSEANAVVQLLDQAALHRVRWVASSVLRLELEGNPDPIRRADALAVVEFAHLFAVPRPETIRRASHLAGLGLRGLDSMHLALAEQEKVDWLVTTDDRFLRRGNRLAHSPTQLINPIDLLRRRFPWLLPKS